MIIDNFLDSYDELKSYSLSANYRDIVNPIDGVIYPNICDCIPPNVKSELLDRITGLLGREPENITMFMRKSPAGVSVPHIAHTDNSMGSYSLMLYLNEASWSGTGFLRHKESGMSFAPESEEYLAVAQRDQNDVSAWHVYEDCPSKENRACIFDAYKFHCALPVGGFGEGAEARTVLTVFFS